MTNSDRNELRRRFVKDNSIKRLALCYVNSAREKVVVQNEVFLNLPEEEIFKYLEIAKKSLSGNIGDNLMELSYTSAQEEGENYRFLMGLKESELKNDSLTDLLFDKIIESYVYDGNFLITVITDSYDVMKKTSDKLNLDESEEVFSYIIVSICPVNQTKAGLGYLPVENRMGAREKDWVAGPPDVAFMFPCFSDRTADIHHVCYYTKDPADLHDEIIDSVLGCGTKKTATQCRVVLREAVNKTFGEENKEKAEDTLLLIHDSLNAILEESSASGEEVSEKTIDRAILTEAVKDVIKEEAYIEKIVETCEEGFDNEPPAAVAFVDKKALKASEGERREKELLKEIQTLKTQIGNTDAALPEKNEGISIIVPPERTDSIRIEDIDGARFVLIPIEEGEEPKIISNR